MDDDQEFMDRLRAFSGDDEMWDGFNPSSWRSILAADEQTNAQELTATAADQILASEEDDWDSDDSAGMILNVHKLTAAERRGYKLNKAREFAADEPDYAVPDPAKLEKVNWAETGLAMGDVSPKGTTFVAWGLVQNYPDAFVGKRNGERAAPLFKLDALHENRVWDLYYIHHPAPTDKKPAVFVPTYQFQHLLDVVNAKLETQLTIPPGKTAERFYLRFGVGNTPRPRFLGRTNSSEVFMTLRKSVPEPHADDDLDKATHLGRGEFQNLLDMSRTPKNKEKKSDKNRGKRTLAHKAWGRSIKRVQRYLGLRARAVDEAALATDMEQVFDLNLPMPASSEGSPLFVAIDIEAWEQDQGLITEVGVAMLDTADIQSVAPGEGGLNWFSLIRARHIRVKENSWAHNTRYVRGCADKFDFGMSELIKQADIPSILEDLIDNATLTDPIDGTTKQRPVVLVFHESSADLKYLDTVGYNSDNAENIVEVVDTREMHQYAVRSNNSASLASVLGSLEIQYKHLHNAGNDAMYTLQAMVGLAVKQRLSSLEAASGKKSQTHVPYSDFREKEGWTSGGEDSDGGYAVKPVNTDGDADAA